MGQERNTTILNKEGCVSLWETIWENMQHIDQRLRSQCVDEPQIRKAYKYERMTSKWGPSHVLDDDDNANGDDGIPYNLNPSSIGIAPHKTAISKQSSDNGTSETANITPEEIEVGDIYVSETASKALGVNKILSATTNCGDISGNASAPMTHGNQENTSVTKPLHTQFTSFQDSMLCTQHTNSDEKNNSILKDSSIIAPSSFHQFVKKYNSTGCGIACGYPPATIFSTNDGAVGMGAKDVNEIHDEQEVMWESNNEAQITFPIKSITVENEAFGLFSESISELTMSSKHALTADENAEMRRMAYYAVNKRHKSTRNHQDRVHANRKCYFTGKQIVAGVPFYAGSLEMGLRTLIVFCLPSAIGLGFHDIRKSKNDNGNEDNTSQNNARVSSREDKEISDALSCNSLASDQSLLDHDEILNKDPSVSVSSVGSSISYNSCNSIYSDNFDDKHPSVHHKSLSPSDLEAYLTMLPEPDDELLDKIKLQYLDHFMTLPIQIRGPNCWRIFVKFCFFSGLPIAEGELHYKVKDEVVEQMNMEEILLSHEVMETVNGPENADILRLPNQKLFKYLKKHYVLQCRKIKEDIFDRKSWENVLAEI